MKTKKAQPPTPADYALALAAYRDEQERLKNVAQKALKAYGKPKMSLNELREALASELGDVPLSELVIEMR